MILKIQNEIMNPIIKHELHDQGWFFLKKDILTHLKLSTSNRTYANVDLIGSLDRFRSEKLNAVKVAVRCRYLSKIEDSDLDQAYELTTQDLDSNRGLSTLREGVDCSEQSLDNYVPLQANTT